MFQMGKWKFLCAPSPAPEVPRLDIVGWARSRLAFAPDEAQAKILCSRSHRVILNCTRQWGKSTITAAKAVHQAVTRPESLTVVISPSSRQSSELVRKAENFVRLLGLPVHGDGDNPISLAFGNGSRIVGLPATEDTVRGFSAVNLLIVDEAARVSDEMYIAVRPMLAVSAGTLWLMSTPRGKTGFFYEVWADGGPDWERVQVPARDCPRIRRSFLDEERRALGDRAFAQEYECAFSDSLTALFARDLLDRALTDSFAPLRF